MRSLTRLSAGLFAASLLFALPACEGPAGADGADGATGADGAAGSAGADGSDGADGSSTLIASKDFYEDAYGCAYGYQVIRMGVDNGDGGGTAADGVLQDGEIDSETLTCLAPDLDEDGFDNIWDNCPLDANVDQGDADFDGEGDACDSSSDGAPMYAITKGNSSTSSSLYRYNVVDGSYELIGDTGHALVTLAMNPADGQLYSIVRGSDWDSGMDVGGWDSALVTLDVSNGAATKVADLQVAPIPSLTFLSDGSAWGWTEDSDEFIGIDTSTGEITYTGWYENSWGHHMGATDDDRIFWMNGGGELWEIDTELGMWSLGELKYTTDGTAWEGEYENGARGDVSGDAHFWVGSGVTYGNSDAYIHIVSLDQDGYPTLIEERATPTAGLSFHAMTWAY